MRSPTVGQSVRFDSVMATGAGGLLILVITPRGVAAASAVLSSLVPRCGHPLSLLAFLCWLFVSMLLSVVRCADEERANS